MNHFSGKLPVFCP